MKLLSWVLRTIAFLIVALLLLDSFGGYFLDGPLGLIPGGALQGAVDANPRPDWSATEEVVELEIRPSKPWSLSVWNVVLDGELYIPSKMGGSRRWTSVALEDPRVRLRTGGRIYERRIVKVEDPALCVRIGQAISDRYGSGAPPPVDDDTWYFPSPHATHEVMGEIA